MCALRIARGVFEVFNRRAELIIKASTPKDQLLAFAEYKDVVILSSERGSGCVEGYISLMGGTTNAENQSSGGWKYSTLMF